MFLPPGMMVLSVFIAPLIAVVIAAIIPWKNLRDPLLVLTACFGMFNMLQVLTLFRETGQVPSFVVTEFFPNVSLAFSVEPLGLIFALIVSFLWIVSTLYTIGYLRGNNEAHQNRFFVFFSLSIFAALGIAFSDNLLTLFIFYEMLTFGTYPLVTHKGDRNALKGGRTYMGILLATSLFLLLPAILLTYSITGTLTFVHGGILQSEASYAQVMILLPLFMYGIGKAALMPIHRWLPAAMVAPTPVSALLHAVAVVKAGVFCIVKVIVYVFGVDYLGGLVQQSWIFGEWLMWIAGFTVVVASIVALSQDNLKKRLAYSTVSQLSYVILAISIFSPKAVIAAAFHIVAHAFGKITLFFAAGSIYTAAHKTKVSELSGVGRRMPVTMIAFTIGALSMIGIPPAVGFISKWYMVTGALSQGTYFVLAVIAISTFLNAAYFLPIIYKAFFEKEPDSSHASYGEAPLAIVVALSITSAGVLALFFYPGVFMELANALVEK